MEVESLEIPELKLIKPDVFGDERGFFVETYRDSRYRELGIDCGFVQDNHSRSVKGTLRGLHLQSAPGQAKLLRVASGRIWDVAVDVRPDSPTYKQWVGVWLDAEAHHQLFIPVGFAHGFYVASDVADVVYKVSANYDPKTETGFSWNDSDIGVEWPLDGAPVLSDRDDNAQSFAQWEAAEAAR
jgi:dTDP-4-dehydrorhamnose 3,5-epimerase